jgi:glycosyltransferase involved in cell wall biosynthesis
MEISLVMPVYNEEEHLEKVLSALFEQTYPHRWEIIVVDGGSTDRTGEILKEMERKAPPHIDFKVVQNPGKKIPTSMNMGILSSRGKYIVRLDGHTIPPPDYLDRSIKGLELSGGKGIVGGGWKIHPWNDSWSAKAIAFSAGHFLGSGNPAYRALHRCSLRQSPFPVDTVPFGAFPRSLWEELGGYDESLHSSEDYDFCYRASKKGFPVLLDPELVLHYFARPNYISLVKQYFRYGYWVSHLLLKHKKIVAIRKLAPLSHLCFLVLLFLLSPLFGVVYLSLYLSVLFGSAFFSFLQKEIPLSLVPGVVFAWVAMHFSYGLGNFLGGISWLGKKIWEKMKNVFSSTGKGGSSTISPGGLISRNSL